MSHPASTAGQPRTYARMRGSKSPRSTAVSRGGHISTGNLVTNEHARCCSGLLARAMILPRTSTKHRDPSRSRCGEDVGAARCSTQRRWSAPASTAPMNFSAISSASRPSCRTPKQRRHGGQRDEHVSSQSAGSGLQMATSALFPSVPLI